MRVERTKVAEWSWDVIGAVVCFGSGILAGLLGSLLTSGGWLWGTEAHPWLRGFGTGLLILTIPLLILAGHCLDRMERESTIRRVKELRTGRDNGDNNQASAGRQSQANRTGDSRTSDKKDWVGSLRL